MHILRNRGTSASPLPIAGDGLALFLNTYSSRSYPGSGTTWYDVSGNGRNFVWTSAAYTAGAPGFFATNGRLARGPASNSFGATNSSGYTVQMLMRRISASNSSAFKWYSSNGAPSSSGGRGVFSHATWGDGNIYFDQGGCCSSNTRTSVSGGNLSTWNVVTIRRIASTRRDIWRNSTLLTANTSAPAAINLSATAADIGGTQEGKTWNANLAAFVLYDRGISDAELTANVSALRELHGL